MKWILIALLLLLLVLGWRFIFRAAMRRPNRGNEFSQDNISG